MTSAAYWKKRFNLLEQSQHDRGAVAFSRIERQYRAAEKSIEGKIAAWYQRFADNNGISLAEARLWLTAKELKEFQWDIHEYIRIGEENAVNGMWIKELENASARFHISRLEALKVQCQQDIEVLFGSQLDTVDQVMRDVYRTGYYHTAFEIQKGVGVGWDFSTLDTRTISKVVNTPWAADGVNFSDRIWASKKKLMSELDSTLTQNIVLGQDPQKAIDTMSRRLGVSKANAGRLVMTEEAYFSSEAQKDCFAELDVEQYEIVATLDSITSEICREMDGKVFKMSDWEVGVTAPPFHPWCRTTTVPYFDDEFDVGERAARGADGKTYYVPANMKYADWEKKFVTDAVNEETKKQYSKYQTVLGANTPSIEEYVQMRYNADEWKAFDAYTKLIRSGELSSLADFQLYQRISKEMDEKLVGITTSNGIKVTGKSDHSIARVIGSVEQRRNGVSVDDVLEALTSDTSEQLQIKEYKNGRSQKFRTSVVEVSVNPDTGNIIQVNPVHSGKKVKP